MDRPKFDQSLVYAQNHPLNSQNRSLVAIQAFLSLGPFLIGVRALVLR